MKKIFVLSVSLILLASVQVRAETFNLKYLNSGVRPEKAFDKASGKQLWQSRVKVEKFNYEGSPMLYIAEDGSGIYGKEHKYKTWHSDAYYKFRNSTPLPYQTKIVYKDENGRLLQTIEKFYAQPGNKVVCRINGKDQSFDMKDDLIDKELVGTALANYPFAEKRDLLFHFMTNEPKIYPMTIKYIGQENLKLGEKTVAAHKLQMIPDLGALNIFGAFVPKTYFWFRAEEPYEFLRYEGLESGLGTPYIAIEEQLE